MSEAIPGMQEAPPPAEPRDAAVVVLVRMGPRGLETFWLRRERTVSFAAGFYAFPGGRVEPSDRDFEHAAARELEEETGVVLAPPLAGAISAGRWVTPEFLPHRFDARYLLLQVGDDVAPDARRSGGELCGDAWVEPAQAIAQFEAGSWLVPSSVLRILRELERGFTGDIAARIDAAVAGGLVESRGLVFVGVLTFLLLVTVGFVYDWRKGIFRWR